MSRVVAVALTLWGVVSLVVPCIVRTRFRLECPLAWSLSGVLMRLRQSGIERLSLSTKPAKMGFSDLPCELRLAIYDMACWPNATDGSTPGALHVLLLSKTISQEARPFVEGIPHTIILADGQLLDTEAEIWGMPRSINQSFHHSLKRLIIVLNICSIGKMSPDTFDVNIPKTARTQWYNLKKVVGIWPDVRETPLQEIKIVLQASTAPVDVETYRAELIRYIRNFKQTTVWAESGNCGRPRAGSKRPSKLLPLARAFNEARKNWIEEADFDHNLLIRFGEQRVEARRVDGKSDESWMIRPSEDTSRTDGMEYPPLTEVEERYIKSKMERNDCMGQVGFDCEICLAHFEDRKVYLDHVT